MLGYLLALLLGLWIGSVWAYWGFTVAISHLREEHSKELSDIIKQLKGGPNGYS